LSPEGKGKRPQGIFRGERTQSVRSLRIHAPIRPEKEEEEKGEGGGGEKEGRGDVDRISMIVVGAGRGGKKGGTGRKRRVRDLVLYLAQSPRIREKNRGG